MPLTEEQLLQRDAGRDLGEELLQAIRDVKAGNLGDRYTVTPNASTQPVAQPAS